METLADLLTIGWLQEFVNDYDWVWPICEILHFAGMALLIGTVGFLDVRILGLGKGIPVASLDPLVRLGIVGFALNVLSGFVFVAGNDAGAMTYLGNLAFQLKMLFILIAGVNLAYFHFGGLARATENTGADGNPPTGAKLVAALSLLLWFGVIYLGRMVMYNDTLLYALGR
jgi:hypothetical protein